MAADSIEQGGAQSGQSGWPQSSMRPAADGALPAGYSLLLRAWFRNLGEEAKAHGQRYQPRCPAVSPRYLAPAAAVDSANSLPILSHAGLGGRDQHLPGRGIQARHDLGNRRDLGTVTRIIDARHAKLAGVAKSFQ